MASDRVQIITDSTCALPPDSGAEARDHVRYLRTSVQFESETWLEGSFTLEQFYDRIGTSSQLPHSSQPSPHEYTRVFQEAATHGPVLAILLSSALSGTYATGVQMAREMPHADIALFDSQFFSSALGYMVAEATEMALSGATREAIIERLQWRRQRTSLFIAIHTLSYLRRSGRVNWLQAGLASALNLKPILATQQGALEVVARVRSRQRSLERLLALAEGQAQRLNGPLWISAMHGRALDAAEWLLDTAANRLPIERHFISEAPASVALHGGPGVVGIMVTEAGPPPASSRGRR